MLLCEFELQVIVVNYEDSHTTMEAPDEDDESSYKYTLLVTAVCYALEALVLFLRMEQCLLWCTRAKHITCSTSWIDSAQA